MPYRLTKIDESSGAVTIGTEVGGADIQVLSPPSIGASGLRFAHQRLSDVDVTSPISAGSSVAIPVDDITGFTIGDIVLLQRQAALDEIDAEMVTLEDVNVGSSFFTVRTLVTDLLAGDKAYRLSVPYDKVVFLLPGLSEVTEFSLYGSVNDQLLFRRIYEELPQLEFDRMVTLLGATITPGTRDDEIQQLIDELFTGKLLTNPVSGQGTFNPENPTFDASLIKDLSCGSFEDQFENFSGTSTFDEFIFEVPFTLSLIRVSCTTKTTTASDAYITVVKNGVVTIVGAGPAAPDRHLPAIGGQSKGLDIIANCLKGDIIRVRLNLDNANVVDRAKVVLGYVCPITQLTD